MKRYVFIMGIAVLSLTFYAQGLYAHCDTMDGPVVSDAQKAFDTKNINYILKWVKAEDEAEVKEAFQLVMKVRPLNPDAKQLAEKYFYDVLVRIHRAGEGEPFTGVKPSGTPIDERLIEADKSLKTGDLAALEKMVPKDKVPELKKRFDKAMALKKFNINNVKAGREYIEAYVQYFKFAEGEEGHAKHIERHSDNTAGEAEQQLLFSSIILSGIFFITTMIFGILYFRSKKSTAYLKE